MKLTVKWGSRACRICLSLILVLGLCACGQKAGATWQEQYDLGVKYLNEGNYEEAVIAFTAAIEIDEKRPEGFIGRGDAYMGQAEGGEADSLYRDALADYLAALDLDDRLAEAYEKAAGVYVSLGDVDAAIELLERGAEVTGDSGLSDYLEELQAGQSAEELPEEEGILVLNGQTVYRPDGSLAAEYRYFYDEAGYLMRCEYSTFDGAGGLERSSTEQWTYDTAADTWWYCPDRQPYGSEEAWQKAWTEAPRSPGTRIRHVADQGVDYSACINPLILDENWQSQLENGTTLYRTDSNGLLTWDYAVYTFDGQQRPVSISSYGSDGAITGTAVLEWEVMEPAGGAE